jgi:hypothetical protein
MFFESSKPVTGPEFFNRQRELAELQRSVEILRQGSTHYLARPPQGGQDQPPAALRGSHRHP